MRLHRFAILLTIASMAALLLPAMASAKPRAMIVVLKPGASVSAAEKRHGASATHVFKSAINGYSATLSDAAQARVANDPNVLFVSVDRVISLGGKPGPAPTPPPAPAQVVPTGVMRIGGMASKTAAIDGLGTGLGVDVAVIDTGITAGNSQLNVVGGKNCSTGASYADGNGHGSHVSGTIAAKDDNTGVVGVAPGARLWAVRVLNNAGSGTLSDVICGIDWVTTNASVIEVANMSLGAAGADDRNCGKTNNDAMHAAICKSVAAGVVYSVAAGNDGVNAAQFTPAAYDEVVTVSALADFNGLAGGGATATCRVDVDDTFADFSNFGADVDIAAPGVCIYSSWTGSGYNTISGTSMASPHVAGALALYRSLNPTASPAAARQALLDAATTGSITGDTDGFAEGVLNVAAL